MFGVFAPILTLLHLALVVPAPAGPEGVGEGIPALSPPPSPDPAPPAPQGPGRVRFSAWVGREVRWATADAQRTSSNVGGLVVQGPLVAGESSIADLRVDLAVRALPEEEEEGVIDPSDPATWGESAEVHIAVSRGVGVLEPGGGQRVTTSLMLRVGWSTGIGTATGQYLRDWSARAEFVERQSGARLSVGYGHHPLGGGLCAQVDGLFPFATLGLGIRTTLMGEAFLGPNRSFMRVVAAVAR